MMNFFSIIKQFIFIGAFFAVTMGELQAQKIAIIVNAKMKLQRQSLTTRQVQSIFLRKTLLSPQGERWNPVNLKANDPLRLFLTQKILHKSQFELERYWSEQYFNGISPPYVVLSEEAVLRFVVETPNAIGYILACHIDKRVTPVYFFEMKGRHLSRCVSQ